MNYFIVVQLPLPAFSRSFCFKGTHRQSRPLLCSRWSTCLQNVLDLLFLTWWVIDKKKTAVYSLAKRPMATTVRMCLSWFRYRWGLYPCSLPNVRRGPNSTFHGLTDSDALSYRTRLENWGSSRSISIRLSSLGCPNHTGGAVGHVILGVNRPVAMLAEGLIFGHESREDCVTSRGIPRESCNLVSVLGSQGCRYHLTVNCIDHVGYRTPISIKEKTSCFDFVNF